MYSILSSLERIETKLNEPQYRGKEDVIDLRGFPDDNIAVSKKYITYEDTKTSEIKTIFRLSTFSICVTATGSAYLVDNKELINVNADVQMYNIPE